MNGFLAFMLYFAISWVSLGIIVHFGVIWSILYFSEHRRRFQIQWFLSKLECGPVKAFVFMVGGFLVSVVCWPHVFVKEKAE